MKNSGSWIRTSKRSISSPTSGQRHGKSMRNGIAFTITSKNLSVANVPLEMSPWSCARSSRITYSNVNRSIIPMLISHAIRQPAIIRRSKIAYKEKMLRENLNDFLEKIEWKEVKKEYLTLDEVKKLAATPCKIPVLKQASLFACMTGLRISDILKLDWRDFEVGPDLGYYIRICTEKTETEATLPISQEALELCGEWGTGKVFKGLTRSMTHHPLKQWIAEAGIRKHITFHCFRHSYAVIQISLGTDIYTVSKMLTHKNVTTTQIYADLVNSKKRETANKISLK